MARVKISAKKKSWDTASDLKAFFSEIKKFISKNKNADREQVIEHLMGVGNLSRSEAQAICYEYSQTPQTKVTRIKKPISGFFK